MFARLVLVLSVLAMPFGMAPVAAAPHHMAMAAMPAHCPEQGSKHQSKGAFAECTMACASALPAADRPQGDMMPYEPAFVAEKAMPVLDGLHPDTATPPPRTA